MTDNKHPADELALVRQRIRELKEQEDDLRTQLIELPRQERAGVKYEARVVDRDRRSLDAAKLEKELGDIRRFYKSTDVVTVYLDKLK